MFMNMHGAKSPFKNLKGVCHRLYSFWPMKVPTPAYGPKVGPGPSPASHDGVITPRSRLK